MQARARGPSGGTRTREASGSRCHWEAARPSTRRRLPDARRRGRTLRSCAAKTPAPVRENPRTAPAGTRARGRYRSELSDRSAAYPPYHQSTDQHGERHDRQDASIFDNERGDPLPVATDREAKIAHGAVPDAGRRAYGNRRGQRRHAKRASERRYQRANAGDEAARKKRNEPVAAVQALEPLLRSRSFVSEQPLMQSLGAVTAADAVHHHGAADVTEPCRSEGGGDAALTPGCEKTANGNDGVSRNWREDILDRRDDGECGVQRAEGHGGQPGEERRHHYGVESLGARLATAMQANPSPRPIHPIPSFVFPLTLTSVVVTRRARASAARIASRCGAMRGSSAMMVMST